MITRRILYITIAGLVGLVLLIGAYQLWHYRRSVAAQDRLQKGQTGAVVESAKDALATQARSQADERASEALTRTNDKEIRNAEGADAKVGPAVHDVGLRSLCRRPAYRDSERCRVLSARPR